MKKLMVLFVALAACNGDAQNSIGNTKGLPECDDALSITPCWLVAKNMSILPPLYLVCETVGPPGSEITKACEYVEISRAMQNVLDAYGRYHVAHDAMLEAEAEVNRLAEIARAEGYLFGHDEQKCGKNDWSNFNEKWAGTLHDCFKIFSLPLR